MKRLLLILTLQIIFLFDVWAQRMISGKIVSFDNQQPIPGVNVLVKDSRVGTVTDLEGEFNLELPAGSTTLVVSYVGYITEEIEVNNRSRIELQLMPDITELNELVVVGYGTSSRKLLSGSVSDLGGEEIENIVVPGLDAAIQGKVTGVQINQNSGTPGGAVSVEIRGANSISAGSQPLYVVDGVPITTGDFAQIGMEGQGINALTDLDPDDIESITVLKDASAAAIYGARAGNGVILIETRSGKSGKTRTNVSAYTGIQSTQKQLDLLNSTEFIEYLNEVSPGLGNSFDPAVNTNWQDEIFREAPISEIEFDISGGSEKTTFFLSGGYFTQEGIVIGTDFNRLNGRINIDHQVSDRFRLGTRITTSNSVHQRVPGDQTINGVLPNAISKPPVLKIRDENNDYLEEGFWPNPVAIGNEVTNQNVAFRNISNIFGEYDILPELTFRNQWGIDFYNLQERRYEPTTTRRGSQSNGYGIEASTKIVRIVQQSTLNYAKTWGKHDLSVLGGYSFEKENVNSNFIQGVNFPNDGFEYVSEAGTIEETNTDFTELALESFFGRINYIFDSRYILTLNFRRDGSSNFGRNNRYANFPGGSIAWRVSEEDFFPETALSDLKIRAGYGLVGNYNIGSFGYLNSYSGGFNYLNNPGLVPSRIPNPDLKWETSAQFSAGIDLEFWEGRLAVIADVYHYRTYDLLLNRPLPGSLGFTSVDSNIGELQNQGVELGINGRVVDLDNFSWVSNFNISFNRNEVTKLYQDQPITNVGRGNNAVLVGEPIGVFYQLKSLGVDPSTGDLVFEDVDFNNTINDNDRQVVGNPNPDFTGGFTNTFKYGPIDLNIFFQFVYGNEIYNGVRQYAENMTFAENDNQLSSIRQRWREPGDRAPIPRINGLFNNDITSHFLEDGSFLRLRNITLGYNFPRETFSELGINSIRLYVTGQNLYTLTNYSGLDPEVNYSGINNIRRGTDFFTFPQARVFTAGLKVSF